MPTWLEIELLIFPVLVLMIGSIIMSAVRFSRLETKVEHLESNGSMPKESAELLTKIDGKLDGVAERLSHFEGYMQRDREG